jgi:aminoglycoside phosphotransferase family enzyme/predicted kinase
VTESGIERAIPDDQLIHDLSQPAAYSWPVERVEQLETHISRLFFAGSRVVKLKRPVEYGFVDHRSLEARRRSCEDEVRLNQRLSDDIYLSCEPVTLVDGSARLGRSGTPIEWATVMRKLPADSMLDVRLERGQRPHALAERLADRLIPFHQRIDQCAGDPATQAERAERIVRENLDEIAALQSDVVFALEFAAIRERMLRFLDTHPAAIRDRAAAGWIREGHGDLKCEHVTLDPPGSLQVYDCVEFNIDIRCADIASDLAFLLLDLERLGAADVAAELVERYRAAGIDLPDAMLTLYRAHRALVRVKVGALTTQNASDHGDAVAAARDTAFWLHRATAAVFAMRPAIVAMSGFSGTGKSVVAASIADALDAPILATDRLRRESMTAPDRYDPANRLAVYQLMMERARSVIDAGQPVILDGAFLRDEERSLAAKLALETGTPLLFVHVVANPEVTERRIRARAEHPGATASEATIDVLHAQRAEAESSPVSWPNPSTVVTIDTTNDEPASLDPLLTHLSTLTLLAPRI